MQKPTQNDYPIHPLLQQRWSPRAFSAQPVEPDKLLSLFEAARWSPSGGNLQPWAFIVTTPANPGPHDALVSALAGGNALWAGQAPVLALAVARREREAGKTNPYAYYDLGQAVAHLTVQAAELGISVHQMAGFDAQKARELFEIPADYDPATVIAIGYQGDSAVLPDTLREREGEARTRKRLADFVFEGRWNEPLAVAAPSVLSAAS